MQIRREYLDRYLHNIAVDQLMADYQKKGYEVSRESKVGDFRADLVARKADEVVVFEIKTGPMTPQKRNQIVGLGDYVRSQKNYKFLVVVATPPKRKEIDIPNLDELLFDHLASHLPPELDSLSTQTRLDAVEDATVDELTVLEQGGFEAKGSGTVEVELHYGSDKDERDALYDSFSFEFEAVLRQNDRNELIIDEMRRICVDTSSFFE